MSKPTLPPKIVQDPKKEPVATEVIAQELIALCDAVQELNSSRLKRNALTLLIQFSMPKNERLPLATIDLILNCLTELKRNYIK